MESEEIQMYEHQLSSVTEALSSDPNNQELLNLKSELTDLIDLTRQLAEQQNASSGSSSHNKDNNKSSSGSKSAIASDDPKWKSGDQVMARYKDGKFYQARITSVGGSPVSPIYTIIFKGYTSTEQVSYSDLRPLKSDPSNSKKRALDSDSTPSSPSIPPPPTTVTKTPSGTSSPIPPPPPSNNSDPSIPPPPSSIPPPPPPPSTSTSTSSPKPKPPLDSEDQERERKKRRNEKKYERNQTKATEAKEKQQSWQKFAKKGKAGLTKESMFKTPDDPLAKVGIVGADRKSSQQSTSRTRLRNE